LKSFVNHEVTRSWIDRRPWSVTFRVLVWHITFIKMHLFEGTSTVFFCLKNSGAGTVAMFHS